jgi:hypothetical protein
VVELPFAADSCPCEKLRTVLPFSVGIRDGLVLTTGGGEQEEEVKEKRESGAKRRFQAGLIHPKSDALSVTRALLAYEAAGDPIAQVRVKTSQQNSCTNSINKGISRSCVPLKQTLPKDD